MYFPFSCSHLFPFFPWKGKIKLRLPNFLTFVIFFISVHQFFICNHFNGFYVKGIFFLQTAPKRLANIWVTTITQTICISLKYTKNKLDSAFVPKMETYSYSRKSRKTKSNIFLLKNAKYKENQILIDQNFTWKVVVNALFRWQKRCLANF